MHPDMAPLADTDTERPNKRARHDRKDLRNSEYDSAYEFDAKSKTQKMSEHFAHMHTESESEGE